MTQHTLDLKAISLFSGAGGFDLGIEAAGFSTLFATDIDSACCETLRSNKRNAAKIDKPFLQKAMIVQSCVKDLDADEILSGLDLRPGEIDLLIGGPPCQSFSVIGQRNGRNDPNGLLIDEYLRLLGGIRPRVFIFENVKGIKSIDGGKLFEELTDRMRRPASDLQYTLSPFCLNASDYGVPQNRERVFIIGCESGIELDSIPPICERLAARHDQPPKRRTVADALRGLPDAETTFPPNHRGRNHSNRIAERYASLEPGARDPKTRINKLDLSKPGFTVVSGSANSGGKGHIHPTKPREVTPRESARLQTFPDWWEFMGNTAADARRQIGNAVPPLLAALIADEVKFSCLDRKREDFHSIVEILDQSFLGFH